MVSSVYWEWDLLIQSMKLGIKVAFIYDGILLFRMLISHKNIIIAAEDFLYWIYVTMIAFEFQLSQTNGILRGFYIWGMALGMILYNKLFGEKILCIAEKWILLIKRKLTLLKKKLTIKLRKLIDTSKMYRSKDGKKKNSGKKKKTKPSGNDIGNDGGSDFDASSSCE